MKTAYSDWNKKLGIRSGVRIESLSSFRVRNQRREDFHVSKFEEYLETNKGKVVTCSFCGKAERLRRAHEEGWRYSRVFRYACPDCSNYSDSY